VLIGTEKDWNDYVVSAEAVSRGPGFQGLRDAILGRAEIRPGENVLDLGSGTGLLTLAAAASAERVWALDISRGMCEYLDAKARSAELANVEPIVASIVSVPLVDESVDVVISNYCFHHLDDAGKLVALREVHRVLAPGGRVVIGDMMFSLALGDERNRLVIRSKVRALLSKGAPGAWRLARNGARYLSGRWERPTRPAWWESALAETGFIDIMVTPLDHEGGIASGRRPS
jgi:ubiquinone/menaquinone biosynthesis C-methylase UbiE